MSASVAPRERLVAAFLLSLMVLGSVVLWIGVPAAGLWLASKVSDSFALHMPIALALIVPGLFLGAAALAWINELYLRVVTAGERPQAGWRVRRGGPIEGILAITFLIAVIAMLFWFFVLAENPSTQVL